MKIKQVTVRDGEYLGPIDWDFDFDILSWDNGGCMNPVIIKESVENLRKLESGDKYEATTDGGCPRVGWGEVTMVGMYDGWPYWRPHPSIYISGILGGGWHSFSSVTEIRKI